MYTLWVDEWVSQMADQEENVNVISDVSPGRLDVFLFWTQMSVALKKKKLGCEVELSNQTIKNDISALGETIWFV